MKRWPSLLTGVLIALCVPGVILLSVEGCARLIPARTLPNGVLRPQSLAPEDRALIQYRAKGYRGRRPCRECPSNLTRIVTMGGSSTYGVPMAQAHLTYTAELQRLLDRNRPTERFEVLNGGIAGVGVWQIVEALESYVVADRPAIVMVCAWFNDASTIPGWYGYHALSDRQAYARVQRLRFIESLWIYPWLHKSRAFQLLRALVTKAWISGSPTESPSGVRRKAKRKRRSSPEEFRAGLERIVELSRLHQFQLVFITEATNRPYSFVEAKKRNAYLRVVEDVGQRHGVTVVDTFTPLATRSGEWLFYDFIHPNPHGHRVIADAVYRAVWGPRASPEE